jgi:hypothetical protein
VAEDVISQPGGDTSGTSAGSQSKDRSKANFEPTEDEKRVVRSWLDRAQRAEDADLYKTWKVDLKQLRSYVYGEKHDDASGKKLVRTNMVFATIAAQMPELYAKNPQIAVTPSENVPENELGKVKRFASTGEKIVRKLLVEEGRLKKRAKANIRATCCTSYGVLKMLYQCEYRGDPLIVRRIEDTQDNLATIEQTLAEMKDNDDIGKLAQQRDVVSANLKALSARNEVKIYKGFVIDRMKSEDFLVLDDNVDEFDEYVDADALAQKVWMKVSDAKRQFRMESIHGATKYGTPRADAGDRMTDIPLDEQYICVLEIWDKKNGVVRTTAKGMNRWLREPYPPENTAERWYPFFVLGFNLVEGRWRPISDVELLMGLQDEYNNTRTNYADVREKAAPKRIIRKGGNLTETDVTNIMTSGNKDWVAVEGSPAMPITQDVMELKGMTIDPLAYDVSIIRNDMDLVVGRSDASRANLIKPKTATEAEIMQQAMSTRTAERRDTHEDMLSEMGSAALQIALRDLTRDEAIQIAGSDAEWPNEPATVEEIFGMVTVNVRAGSSGKPNVTQEREQWGQLLPQIEKTMQGVREARAMGSFDTADAMIELLRETLRRFDETLDIDSLIPPAERDKDGKPVAGAMLGQQLMQCKEQLAELQKELAKCQQDLQKAQAGEQAKVAQIQAESQLNIEQEKTNQITEGAKAKREEDAAMADASFQRWKALLDAATKIITTEISSAMAAKAGDEEAQQQATEAALSEDRMGKVITDLQETMDRLGSAFDRFATQQPKGAG